MIEEWTSPTRCLDAPAAPDGEPGRRWSVGRKRAAVLRLLRGDSPERLAGELGIAVERLRAWQQKALLGIDVALRERALDPLQAELDAAQKSLRELVMENELLRARCRQTGPLASTRSSR